MIKFLLLLLGISYGMNAMASQTDTSAYQTQRLKINGLLAERSAKFGQYELSLAARTGIFGLQTKDDIRNSSEILRQVILSDNNIFRELKILMNYKDQEVQQIQNNASMTKTRMQGYMLTIKKLQDQNDLLKSKIAQVDTKRGLSTYIIIFLILIIVAGGIFFTNKFKSQIN